MKIQTLSKAGAYRPGADIWVIPELNSSKWSRQIDWYLNFIISRGTTHSPKKLSKTLTHILSENDMKLTPFKLNKQAPLMFASQHRLPNKQTVLLPLNKEKVKWIQSILKLWSGLNHPFIRVFLPPNFTDEEFNSLSPQDSEFLNKVTLVPSLK